MLFNSLEFLIYFPIVIFIYFAMPQKFRNIFLLAASYYFYMQWNAKYFVLIGFSTLVTYYASKLMGSVNSKPTGARRRYLIYSLIINLGILFTFKYYVLFADVINRALAVVGTLSIPPTFNLLLPVGISFYTFQALSYTIDVYRGDIEPENNLIDYALFVSFFPQLVAGPIERSGRLLSEIKKDTRLTLDSIVKGGFLMAVGYFLKLVIADRAAIIVNAVFADPHAYSGGAIALSCALFSIQLYCDFYSYSIIAKGCARVMGIELMDNFRQPFFATSIKDLWHRWHISLSTWFRDYLYIPLGGSKKGIARTYFNVMTVFLLSGLWHGANLTFVIWGGLHGMFQVIGSIKDKFMGKRLRAYVDNSVILKIPRMIFSFVLFTFSMYFFRAQNIGTAVNMIVITLRNFSLGSSVLDEIAASGAGYAGINVLLIALVLLLFFSACKERFSDIDKRYAELPYIIRLIIMLLLLMCILIFGIYGPGFSESQFIYFQF